MESNRTQAAGSTVPGLGVKGLCSRRGGAGRQDWLSSSLDLCRLQSGGHRPCPKLSSSWPQDDGCSWGWFGAPSRAVILPLWSLEQIRHYPTA